MEEKLVGKRNPKETSPNTLLRLYQVKPIIRYICTNEGNH